MRRTKIVCTIGPSTAHADGIRALILAGMNVARLNFSHGTHDDHREVYGLVRSIANELDRNVAIMMDLQGPKIRTGPLADGKAVWLEEGKAIRITTREVVGTAECVSTTYENLPYDVRSGDRILIADGVLELRVERVDAPDVDCRIVRGGKLGQHKGINLPGVAVSSPCLTPKDHEDLEFGLGLGVDFVALSFVRSPGDVITLREHIQRAGKTTQIIAKIERPEALTCFDDILEHADAIMVARGDLGVEVELEDVPQIQKELIQRCNNHGKPVITATQMLESMVGNSRPTRAEAGDVANAIYDGTDAVMLSAETASGEYPIDAVRVMAEIARRADEAVLLQPRRLLSHRSDDAKVRHDSFSDAIGQSVARMTQMMAVGRVICFTKSGYTAMAIARYRPNVPVTAVANSGETARRCALMWGVDAIHGQPAADTDSMLAMVEAIAIERHMVQKGDVIVVVAGIPLGEGGRTNLLKLHRVGYHA